MEIKRVGIIGAGQMGNGIVHVCALAGYDVYLHDVSQTALSAAPGVIAANMDRQVSRGKITPLSVSPSPLSVSPPRPLCSRAGGASVLSVPAPRAWHTRQGGRHQRRAEEKAV